MYPQKNEDVEFLIDYTGVKKVLKRKEKKDPDDFEIPEGMDSYYMQHTMLKPDTVDREEYDEMIQIGNDTGNYRTLEFRGFLEKPTPWEETDSRGRKTGGEILIGPDSTGIIASPGLTYEGSKKLVSGEILDVFVDLDGNKHYTKHPDELQGKINAINAYNVNKETERFRTDAKSYVSAYQRNNEYTTKNEMNRILREAGYEPKKR